VETDDPELVIDRDENTRQIAFLVLPGAKTEPIVKRGHPARKRRPVMLAKRFDQFDHARSAEEMTMTPQSFHQAWRRIVWPSDRRGERVTISARQNHALMLVENPASTLIGKIAGGKTGDRHGLLDHLFCRWC
jgi:hypothetical protein